jgi:hypothetical protein
VINLVDGGGGLWLKGIEKAARARRRSDVEGRDGGAGTKNEVIPTADEGKDQGEF